LSDHIEGDGEAFFREIEKFRLEGMMAKRADSKYVQKRSSDWLKIKTVMRQEVVIGGYTQPRGTRVFF
jgi:bifunctional non-homologous end joining protein LigD